MLVLFPLSLELMSVSLKSCKWLVIGYVPPVGVLFLQKIDVL